MAADLTLEAYQAGAAKLARVILLGSGSLARQFSLLPSAEAVYKVPLAIRSEKRLYQVGDNTD
jgi:hypothetical protein